jgi:hypothetical protein
MMTTPGLKTFQGIRMNEIDAVHVDVEWKEIFKFIGYGIFAVMVWLLKKFGESHLASMKELANELKEMRRELNALSTRVTAVEIRTNINHRNEP